MMEGLKRIVEAMGAVAAGIVAFIIAIAALYFALRVFYRAWWRVARRPRGKSALLIYSHSPKWQNHVETLWLPKLKDVVVVLNTSTTSVDGIFDRAMFRYFAGDKEHTPSAIVFDGLGRVRVIRFFKAFQKAKHGKKAQLVKLEEELFSLLGVERSNLPPQQTRDEAARP